MSSKKKRTKSKRQHGGDVDPDALRNQFFSGLERAGLRLGPPHAPTPWYLTPFQGVKNAATEINHNPIIQKSLDLLPYGVGTAVKQGAQQIGNGDEIGKGILSF